MKKVKMIAIVNGVEFDLFEIDSETGSIGLQFTPSETTQEPQITFISPDNKTTLVLKAKSCQDTTPQQ